MSVTSCFGPATMTRDPDQSVKPNHEPPHDLIAGACSSGSMNLPAVSIAAWQTITTIGRLPSVLL